MPNETATIPIAVTPETEVRWRLGGFRLYWKLISKVRGPSSHAALPCHKPSDKLVDHPAVARSISIWIRSEVAHL